MINNIFFGLKISYFSKKKEWLDLKILDYLRLRLEPGKYYVQKIERKVER